MPAYKTIGIDTYTSSGYKTGVSSFSFSITVASNSNRILSVIFTARGGSTGISSITANGRAMTMRKVSAQFDQCYCEIWDLVNPDVGSNTIVVTTTGTPSANFCSAISFYNADVGVPVDVTAEDQRNGDPSVTFTSTIDGSLAIDGFFSVKNGLLSVGAGQTSIGQQSSGDVGGSSYKIINAGSNTMSWSNNSGNAESHAVVVYKPARVSGGAFLLHFI